MDHTEWRAAHPVQLTNKPIYLDVAGIKDLALGYTRYIFILLRR